jgi:dihydroxyacetone kinase-like protein
VIIGLGATPLEELYLMYRHVHQILAESRCVFRVWIGEFGDGNGDDRYVH